VNPIHSRGFDFSRHILPPKSLSRINGSCKNGRTSKVKVYNHESLTPTILQRLFGDANGDANVNSTDFALFRSTFGLGASIFDFNYDSSTNSDDFSEFRKRFGLMIEGCVQQRFRCIALQCGG